MKTISLLVIGTLSLGLAVFAADYLGADAVLKQISSKLSAALTTDADSRDKLKNDLEAFRKINATLAPEEAAKQWLDLADRFGKLSLQGRGEDNSSDESEPMSFQTMVAALPPPAAWDALVKLVEARPEGTDAAGLRTILFRLTAHWLTQNSEAQLKDAAALETLSGKVKGQMREYRMQASTALKSQLLLGSDDSEAILKNLNDQLALFTAESTRYSGNEGRSFAVPDLVSLVGEKKATEFLRRALVTKRLQVSINEGDETRKLARKLALEMIKELKTAQWSLAESLDATALYEALEKRFPGEQDQARNAKAYHLLGLLAARRSSDAAKIAIKLGSDLQASLPSDGLAALERAGLTRDLANFFHDLLAQNNDLPYWSQYVRLAAKAGSTDKMIALAESSAARKGLSAKRSAEIKTILRRAYLAADNVDKGIELLRKEIAAGTTNEVSDDIGSFEETESGLTLARLGAVLNRRELIEEGIQAQRAEIKANSGPSKLSNRRSALSSLASLLIELERGQEAEAALLELLSIVEPADSDSYSDPSQSRSTLLELMALYHHAKRPTDVLVLLDKAPQWGAKDLAEIYQEGAGSGHNDDYAGYFAAAALAAVDRKPEALKIINALLDQIGGYDPAFELLVQLDPANAITRLDALFARDKYEERPLIWKAKLLLDQGKLEEAEATAKQAIGIDPSDGEQGPGRRMRVYAVLADIREARGDVKEATFLRGAVTAIRRSEEADRFYGAGLITRAVKMYEEALTHFADAYCIQSRLALRLAELGDTAGAEEHYRRAYELMPDSFGRVESHCFGCEQAFAGERAQSIAEKIFTQIAAKRPEKPQVHYLLGYLRNEQDRPREALPEFRLAVKLDPEYLNAWKQLSSIGRKMRLPAAERDSIQLGMLKLDPLGRHSSFEAGNVTDLKAAWLALEAAAKVKVSEPSALYPLAASAEAEEKAKKAATDQRGRRHFLIRSRSQREDTSPGQVLSQHPLVQNLSNWFSYGEMFAE